MAGPWPATPDPPSPFEPQTILLETGSVLSRVHTNVYGPTQFNPGPKGAGRFSFFGSPTVPVLYAATTDEAAIAETLLRNIPATGGTLTFSQYRHRVLARLTTTRPLRLASFLGAGLRVLGVEPTQLTITPGANYPQTRKWAHAAHAAGFDGIAWMSKHNNSDQSCMFFGDRVHAADLDVVPGSGRMLATGAGRDWLVDLCSPLHIDVLVR